MPLITESDCYNRVFAAVEEVMKRADSQARIIAEVIYEEMLADYDAYFGEVRDMYPNYNTDMDEAADATQWVLDRYEDKHTPVDQYGDLWNEIRSELDEMIFAGLT